MGRRYEPGELVAIADARLDAALVMALRQPDAAHWTGLASNWANIALALRARATNNQDKDRVDG